MLLVVGAPCVAEHGPGFEWSVADLPIQHKHGGAGGPGDGRVGQHSDEPNVGSGEGGGDAEVPGGRPGVFRNHGAAGRRCFPAHSPTIIALAAFRYGVSRGSTGRALRAWGTGDSAGPPEQLYREPELWLRECGVAGDPDLHHHATGLLRALVAGAARGLFVGAVSALSSGHVPYLSAWLGMDPTIASFPGDDPAADGGLETIRGAGGEELLGLPVWSGGNDLRDDQLAADHGALWPGAAGDLPVQHAPLRTVVFRGQ